MIYGQTDRGRRATQQNFKRAIKKNSLIEYVIDIATQPTARLAFGDCALPADDICLDLF